MRRVIPCLPLFLSLNAIGCGKSAETDLRARKAELIPFALAYHDFFGATGSGPTGLDEMLQVPAVAARLANSESVKSRIRSGELVVVWGGRVFDNGDEGEKYVLAYERQAPQEGGIIIRGGGGIELVTAEVFRGLPLLPSEIEPATLPTGEVRSPTWARHTLPGGVCSAEFPWTPLPGRTEAGQLLMNGQQVEPPGKVERLSLKRPPGRGFYTLNKVSPDFPRQASPRELFDEWRDKMLKTPGPDGSSFELAAESPSPQDGVPGQRIDFRVGKKVSLNRVFLVGRDVYRANVVIDADAAGDADARRFLGSVQFRR